MVRRPRSHVNVYLTDDDLAAIDYVVAQRGGSRAVIVREMIQALPTPPPDWRDAWERVRGREVTA